MNLKGIHHIAIICKDYRKSREFYTKVLGCTVLAENYRRERDSYKLDLVLPGGGRLELFSFPEAADRPSYPEAAGLRHLAFEVELLDEVINQLARSGVAVEPVRVDEYTGRRFTFFNDPDGLPLELYEEPRSPSL